MSETRYAIGDLAELGGVSRRTVRYYVQVGLLPEPFGLGRGNHYGPEHLEQLLRVKALQEAGRSLSEIRQTLGGRGAVQEAPAAGVACAPRDAPPSRSMWRRITLAPGVELHVSNTVRLPAPGRLQELATWCRQFFPAVHPLEGEDDGA